MASRKDYNQHGPPWKGRQMTKMRVIRDAEKLEEYTYKKCRNNKVFPKKDRGGLPTRMTNEAIDVLSYLYSANDLDLRDPAEATERLRRQRLALTSCNLLMHHISVIHDNNQITDKTFAYWEELANTVKRQAARWHKSDKDRRAAMAQAGR